MSVWREIWKDSLKANHEMFFNMQAGEQIFKGLLTKYKNDGMLYYARGEAYELKGLKENALADYKRAKEQFPVAHWKDVAENSIKRINQNKTAENYFNRTDFNSFLWFNFQKIYEFVYIDDFVRYVCLSALSRASSEWPLSLIDFRTILEMQVDSLLEAEIPDYDFEGNELNQRISDLSYYGIITDEAVIKSMHWIRKNGNAATHDIKSIQGIDGLSPYEERKECLRLQNFYEVMLCLNDFNKTTYNRGSK